MQPIRDTWLRGVKAALATGALATLVACGGGGADGGAATNDPADSGGSGSALAGTLRVSLTDSPACGYDHVWITVEKVRVHRSGAARDGDAGWVDVPLPQVQPATPPPPLRVDLLTLTNGALVSLGQVQLPAGSYQQMRLVLAANTNGDPYANAVAPSGGRLVALKTPSAQQSGLKMNVDLSVPAGKEVDFAIDFDACKSIVKAGKSGKFLLKPVLRGLPIVSPAGQRIQGWLDPSLAAAAPTVSVQADGQVVRATPPVLDAGGNLGFVLYPVPVGSYTLVVTAAGHATAVVTGVPSQAGVSTTVNSVAAPILPPPTWLQGVSGTVTYGGSAVDTGGVVRALQSLTGGPKVEVASAGADADDGFYAMTLPGGAPVRASYVSGSIPLLFAPDLLVRSRYQLLASVARSSVVKSAQIAVDHGPVLQDFAFAAP